MPDKLYVRGTFAAYTPARRGYAVARSTTAQADRRRLVFLAEVDLDRQAKQRHRWRWFQPRDPSRRRGSFKRHAGCFQSLSEAGGTPMSFTVVQRRAGARRKKNPRVALVLA